MNIINNYYKLFKKSEILLLLFSYLIMPFLIQVNGHINFIYIVLTSNYITLIINTYYLVLIYKKTQSMNNLTHYLITRMGYKEALISIHSFGNSLTLFMTLGLYLFLFIVYGATHMSIDLLWLLVINTFIYFIETNIILLQFNRKPNIMFIVIPIIINLVYHYVFF